MSGGFFEVYMTRDSTYPKGRERAFRVLKLMTERFPNGLPDRAQCYLAGLTTGWLLGHLIGIKDLDDLKDAFPLDPPEGGIRDAIPYGRDETAPEVEALREDELLDESWHQTWMGIRNDLYHFTLRGSAMPERSTLAWLGYLRGELEGEAISNDEYERLKAMLPRVHDEFTPLLAAL